VRAGEKGQKARVGANCSLAESEHRLSCSAVVESLAGVFYLL
jgi:hypothetical protein